MTCNRCDGSGFYLVGKWPKQFPCPKCIGTGMMGNHMFYAGIGSRDTPDEVGSQMTLFATLAAVKGLVLRSGRGKPRTPPTPGTVSADLAFEKGCDLVNGQKVIRTSTASPAALAHAATIHPNWSACDDYARGLHARNSQIMLGDDLEQPVSVVACWTDRGIVQGGTGQALRIAAALNIPIFNFYYPSHVSALMEWVSGL